MFYFTCGTCSGFLFFLNIAWSGTRWGVVKVCVIFFCVWIAIWYCEILFYIVLRVECAMVLGNFVLYFNLCGTRSVVVLYIFSCEECSGNV